MRRSTTSSDITAPGRQVARPRPFVMPGTGQVARFLVTIEVLRRHAVARNDKSTSCDGVECWNWPLTLEHLATVRGQIAQKILNQPRVMPHGSRLSAAHPHTRS